MHTSYVIQQSCFVQTKLRMYYEVTLVCNNITKFSCFNFFSRAKTTLSVNHVYLLHHIENIIYTLHEHNACRAKFYFCMHIRRTLIVLLWERLNKIAHCPYLILVLTD